MFRSVTIIGAGNVAYHLAKVLSEIGIQSLRVYSKHPRQTLFSDELQHLLTDAREIFENPAELVIVAVNDDSIAQVVTQIVDEDQLVVHTSGSVSIDVLKKFRRSGVLYPLQTFSAKRKIHWKGIPFFIEAQTKNDEKLLQELAKQISGQFHHTNSEERMRMHVAAVFVSNFVNHMFVQAKDLINLQDMDFSVFEPLIGETVDKVFEMDPEDAQTGPAVRNDQKTLQKHLDTLENFPDKQALYQMMSEYILKRKRNEEL